MSLNVCFSDCNKISSPKKEHWKSQDLTTLHTDRFSQLNQAFTTVSPSPPACITGTIHVT
jgi:hypothetical protein